MDLKVPFFSNTIDNTHCFQATIRMVLKYFLPDQEYTWEELDRVTAKKAGLWTWPLAGVLELQRLGFDTMNIEIFDYERFIEEGNDYLYKFLGDEVAQAQIENSDILQERELSKEFIKKVDVKKDLPTVEDIIKLLNKGFLVICNVNSRKLRQKEGYAGHFVLIKGYHKDNLILHDPGLPPMKNNVVSKTTFKQAWEYPNEKVKGIMAFRYDR